MVNIPHADLEFYREAEKDAVDFIRELSESISLMKELEETTTDEMDLLLIQEITWDLREMIGDQHGLAKYYRETADKLERIYRRG